MVKKIIPTLSMKKICVLLMGIFLFVAVFAYTTPVSLASGSWVVEGSVPTTRTLYGIWGSDANSIFVVGWEETVLHFDGVSWSGSEGSTYNAFFSIWGASSDMVIAVGVYYEEECDPEMCWPIFYDFAKQYNGTSWSPITIKQDGNALHNSIWGSSENDIFVVGGGIFHYNGLVWSEMPYTITELDAVWGTSGDDVFAAGSFGKIIHYGGSSWSLMNTGTTKNLCGIWGSASDNVFAVGVSGTVLHYDGDTWVPMDSNTTDTLRGVWGSSGENVFAVGDGGTIIHYDGTVWTPMDSNTTDTLRGVWGSSGENVFAVGDGGTIVHYMVPTLVELSSFTIVPRHAQVVLIWTTEAEIDNAGFNVYRADIEEGEYVKINEDLIQSLGTPLEGADYDFVDDGVQNRKTYWYKLEDVDINGVSTVHGPVSATPRMIYGD